MVGLRIDWDEAKRLYERGIITKIELGNCAISYIQRASDPDDGLQRAFEVDAYMDKFN